MCQIRPVREWLAVFFMLMATFTWLMGSQTHAQTTTQAPTHTQVVEMETAIDPQAVSQDQASQNPRLRWAADALEGASGGKVLGATTRVSGKSPQATLTIPRAGRYRLWMRYHRDVPASAGVYVFLRDEDGQVVSFHYLDYSPTIASEQPYKEPLGFGGERTGFIWEPWDAVFERPMKLTITAGVMRPGTRISRQKIAHRALDCLLLTTDLQLDPSAYDLEQLEALASATPPVMETTTAPAGFVVAPGLPAHVDDYAGMPAGTQRFQAGLINNGSQFIDAALQVRLGFNRDHGAPNKQGFEKGVLIQGHVESYRFNDRKMLKEIPSPEGRFINAKGQVSDVFSFHYEPAVQARKKELVRQLEAYEQREYAQRIAAWRTSVEDGGFMDYSEPAKAAFIQWLKHKHGDIATLNKRWATQYESFDDIELPATFEDGKAAWLELREFSGKAYVDAVAWQMPIIDKHDKRKLPRVGATSGLDLMTPYFNAIRPMDFDDLLSRAYANEPYVSWDTYCSDDQLAAETEMMFSFSDGRKPVIQEWSNHAVDPRLAARSYWQLVSKGVKGIFLFMFQEGRGHATYPKWALQSHNGVPKPKLAAYSDAAQELHRLEPIITQGRYTYAVKPVAMYWSRIDLSLAKPHESLYGSAQDSPIHIYATLRGLGYPVRFITPRQIRRGDLKDVSALILADTKYIPGDVASKMEAWVRQGGVVIGDELPGAWNEYAQPQETLVPIFGVKIAQPKARGRQASDLAVQESTQGYGEVTDAAVVRRETYTMIDEIAQQPGATHPVARAVGDFMLSGIGPRKMQCVAGHVIGMTHRGSAGLVINEYGKGKALYCSLMLGTAYASSGTNYEWNHEHSGLALRRVLDEFLQWAGVPKATSTPGLSPYLARKLRVESPLVTPEGDMMIGLVSYNDAPLDAFYLQVALPASLQGGSRGKPAGVFAITGGSRELLPVQYKLGDTHLSVQVPSFDTHAAIVLVMKQPPLVGVKVTGAYQGVAKLPVFEPDMAFKLTATVHNTTGSKLEPGKVNLSLPRGWFATGLQMEMDAIEAGQSAQCEFTIHTPAFAGDPRLVPLLVRFENSRVQSTPATTMVWWQRAGEK